MALLYLYLAVLIGLARIIYLYINDDLKSYPGPFLARWTKAWRLLKVLRTWQRTPVLVDLHRRYGDVVRVGPNVLSFNDPQAINDIYGANKHFRKSDYYPVAAAVARGRSNPSLFSSIDTAWHDNLRRAIQPAFNLTALVQYEPFVNSTVVTFVEQLGKRYAGKAGDDGVVDISDWMHWYAFDVIGELTYGNAFGFLESASDVEGVIKLTNWFLVYGYVVGQMPWLDQILIKNPILLWLNRRGYFNGRPNPAVRWALPRQVARARARAEGKHSMGADGRMDLIDKFLDAKEKHPDTITDREVLGLGLSMVFAGSESTAATLSAIFYHLLKNPHAYQKLQAEIDSYLPQGSGDPVPFQLSLKLQYLDACVKETFRIHPAARFSGERVVPLHGATIAGNEVPPGTVIGVNAWAMHRREDIFGQHVEIYSPERWLPGREEEPEKAKTRVAEMNRCLSQFGTGKFNCIGQHISRLEMYKVIPTLLRAYDFELAEPQKEWRFRPGSFMMVSGVDVRIRRR